MARPKKPRALLRDWRIQVNVDAELGADLRRIAAGWGVQPASAAYWLLKGIVADMRGECVAMGGDDLSERAARWMRSKFPPEELEERPTPRDALGMPPATGSPRRTSKP